MIVAKEEESPGLKPGGSKIKRHEVKDDVRTSHKA